MLASFRSSAAISSPRTGRSSGLPSTPQVTGARWRVASMVEKNAKAGTNSGTGSKPASEANSTQCSMIFRPSEGKPSAGDTKSSRRQRRSCSAEVFGEISALRTPRHPRSRSQQTTAKRSPGSFLASNRRVARSSCQVLSSQHSATGHVARRVISRASERTRRGWRRVSAANLARVASVKIKLG